MRTKSILLPAFLFAILWYALPGLSFPSGMMAYYPLDSDAVDYSDNGNSGTMYGTTRVAGVHGNAFNFNGYSDYISIPDRGGFGFAEGFTAAAWIKPTRGNMWYRIIGKEDPGWNWDNDDWIFGIAMNGGVYLGIYKDGTQYHTNGRTQLTMNAWNFVVGTWDGKGIRTYINGVLQTDTVVALTGPTNHTDHPVLIGKRTDDDYYFSGAMDEIMLFKRALTGQEIDSLYKGYYYGNAPVGDYNLVAYWPFDSASGRLYADVTGHGYNALSSAALGCSPGIYGTAINLPAQNFELIAQNSRDAFYLPAFSVELWFSVNNDPTTMLDVGQYLFDYQSVKLGVRNGYGFYVDPQGHVNWTMAAANGSFWSQLPSTTVIKPGTWYHVVAIYTGSQLQLFINGALEGTVNHVGGYPKSTYDARIGCQRLTDGTLRCFLNGKIDDVKLFNRVLDKEEVLAHYAKNQKVPVLIPFPGNQTVDRRPEFRWHGVPSASVYTISISSTPDFLAPMFYVPDYDTFFRPLANLSMEKLFWRVKSNLSDQWSKVDTFLVAAPVSAAAPAAQGFVPLNAFFNVNVSAGQKYKVMVFAPSGREVSSFDVAEENGNIAGQIKSLRLPSGCYLLALKTNNNIISSTKYLLK